MAYGYEAKPIDFGFIAAAGQQIGQGMAEQEKYNNIKIDDTQAAAAHEEIMLQTAQEYMEATGSDPVKAYAFAAKFFPGKFKSETASEAALRWQNSASKATEALKEAKVQKFHADTAANKPEQYQRPEGNVTVQQPKAAAEPGTPEFSKNPTSFDGLAGMQSRAMNEPPPSDIMTGPAETAMMKTRRAQQLGVSEDKSVASDIQSTQNIEVGQDYLPGQTRAREIAGMAARGIDPTAGAAKAIADATPTEMQVQTDKTKRDIAAENQRLREEYNRINKLRVNLYGQKLTADQRMDIIAEKRKNQDAKDDVEKQIADIQQKMADKDYFGNIDESSRTNLNDQIKALKLSSAIYDEIDSEFSGLLKEKGGVKPVVKQPAPAAQPSKFKIISVK